MFIYLSSNATVDVVLVDAIVFSVANNAKQKHLGCKKVQGQSEATLQTGRRNQKV